MGKIFLSYASDDKSLAKDIQARLRQNGHDVFYDEERLRASDDYDRVIRQRIGSSDVMIFLCSPAAVAEGRYTLTELGMAERHWPNPQGRLLPVLVGGAAIGDLPSYLKGLSVYRPKGDAVSEIAHFAGEMARKQRRKGRNRIAMAIGGLGLALAASLLAWKFLAPAEPSTQTAAVAGDIAASDGDTAEKSPTLSEKLVVTAPDVERVANGEGMEPWLICPGANITFTNDIGEDIALRVSWPPRRGRKNLGIVPHGASATIPGTIDENGFVLHDGRQQRIIAQAQGDPQMC
ncbi:toll/interleukin-1 receptor domain-containing protein [uncultured Parasphingopyxis sp.]|uniref:toll/interleukin-1 receptor domain-containing protein n=1 Tax=uncultured Parasphingopyxis sp. TaxID=1547918 RepID=UPI002622F7D0|nr:toll/interleukin-1 receptor domain-containing protein [uncultured Parasphingopyxis sp.]